MLIKIIHLFPIELLLVQYIFLFLLDNLIDCNNKDYKIIIKEIFKNVFFIQSLYNYFLKEIFIYFGIAYTKTFLFVIYIIAKIFFCKFNNIKYKMILLLYNSLLSMFIFDDNMFFSFTFNYLSNFLIVLLNKTIEKID